MALVTPTWRVFPRWLRPCPPEFCGGPWRIAQDLGVFLQDSPDIPHRFCQFGSALWRSRPQAASAVWPRERPWRRRIRPS